MSRKKPIALIILDGFGYQKEGPYNAISQAKTPTLNFLRTHFPHTLLEAAGRSVGLPAGYPGNSEVGHMTMGAGRIIQQPISLIHQAIADKSFYKNPILQRS